MTGISLDGKIAAITGGASGIGLEAAQALVEAGAIVHLFDRDEEALKTACDEIGATPVAVDLFDYAAVDAAVADIVARHGRFDILYANAGAYVGGKVWEGDASNWDMMLNLNINATFRSVRAVLPAMMAQGSGDVILTSSIAGAVPVVAEPIYTASKHAVQAFVHTVRRQVAPSGVRVAAVLPGPVHTPLLKDWDPERLRKEIDAGALMEPRDVAEAVLFMLTRRKGVIVRDLVILPHSFDI
ncbi:SDR family oxidoreductase [Sphingomonas sp. ACRSK]|uniref:SDR family oxidoreductase n=1 Tax=Sphingomonas sp. ACRSK TaxID=2918213 RepID=UPI001EF5A1BF|nr:SDR family oxidoreductase [Sphingomonas sp. ACRSK]MCG7349609.1 SDR family oxidoreductase [Sphingomonas sp. ACRSK]